MCVALGPHTPQGGRMGDPDGLVAELPLTPAQAESSEDHLCSCPEAPLWQWVSLSLAVSVPQGVGGRHTAMDPAGVQHAQHPDGCGAPSGAAGPEAAAAAGPGDWYLPCPPGALLTVFWCVAGGKGALHSAASFSSPSAQPQALSIPELKPTPS